MTRKAIRIRKLLYNCTIIMLLFGIFSTGVMIQSGYTKNRNRKIINQAKMIQPFYDSDVTIQSGIQAFFGNSGEWSIVNDKIHVSVERGFVSALRPPWNLICHSPAANLIIRKMTNYGLLRMSYWMEKIRRKKKRIHYSAS